MKRHLSDDQEGMLLSATRAANPGDPPIFEEPSNLTYAMQRARSRPERHTEKPHANETSDDNGCLRTLAAAASEGP